MGKAEEDDEEQEGDLAIHLLNQLAGRGRDNINYLSYGIGGVLRVLGEEANTKIHTRTGPSIGGLGRVYKACWRLVICTTLPFEISNGNEYHKNTFEINPETRPLK